MFSLRINNNIVFYFLVVSSIWMGIDSCKKKDNPLFFISHPLDFTNQLDYTDSFNAYLFRNFYNGGGVALGDINNDGLPDIYMAGNQVDNKLFLNTGQLNFEDITQKAGVSCSGVWSTGVSMVDINADGWLDIYVCKSGPLGGPNRHNELFINNGDLTFSEKAAEYGLDELGLSVHAAFFDYDLDGDLDCYLLNNAIQSVVNFTIVPEQRKIRDSKGGNKLLRNDQGRFNDVSEQAGIYGSKIGFGLGVSVSDLNADGWPDIYISNDFFERDYLYINQQNGTFKESLEDQISEISLGAMGADIADCNNDGWPDIFVTDMLPMTPERYKSKTQFEDWNKFQLNVRQGYYHQFTRNTLQLNNGNQTFSEIGRLAGVAASDWSWGALILDLNNDGWNDIFVANGIYKDLTDQDYINYMTDPQIIARIKQRDPGVITTLMDSIPSVPIPNCVFINQMNLTFRDESKNMGLGEPSFSNGSAFDDLDGDGDLDLVINNINMSSRIYENRSIQLSSNGYLKVKFIGPKQNPNGIGTRVTLHRGDTILMREVFPGRGFMSSSSTYLHFGLGYKKDWDSLMVLWPGGNKQIILNPLVDTIITLKYEDAKSIKMDRPIVDSLTVFQEVTSVLLGNHLENNFNDFDRDFLLFHQLSMEGPRVAQGDFDGDGASDLAVGDGAGQPGQLYFQTKLGFTRKTPTFLDSNRISEYSVVHSFDADGDGDIDLYFGAGGNEYPQSSSAMIDWLLLNDGKGNFLCSQQTLPSFVYQSTSSVCHADVDGDHDLDLFVGARHIPFYYGILPPAFLLINNGHGLFTDVSASSLPSHQQFGMVTDASFADLDADGDEDLCVVGEWMAPSIFLNQQGKFSLDTLNGLQDYKGWWHRLVVRDINNDGHLDIIAGNHGLNSRYLGTPQNPVSLIINDFDQNGAIDPIYAYQVGDILFPYALKQDMVKQIPTVNKKFLRYADYASASLRDIFGQNALDKSLKYVVKEMRSMVFMNDGRGLFKAHPLPIESQFSPVYALLADDINKDGRIDLIIGGNFAGAKPEAGTYLAGFGLYLQGLGDGNFDVVPARRSGISVKGQIRDIQTIKIDNQDHFVFFRNNAAPIIYQKTH